MIRHPVLLALLLACGGPTEREATEHPRPTESTAAPAETAGDSVALVFTREEAPVIVKRAVPAGAVDLRTALEQLLAGPTPEERAAGLGSWFSAATSGALRSVEVDTDGQATVDFHDLRSLIPNASSSAGSAMLLQQLNGTVFQFPEIRSVEYRMEGSCDLFWNWLQFDCEVVTRPGA